MAKQDALEIRLGVRKLQAGGLAALFASMPEKAQAVAIPAAAKYMLEKFKKYPPYKWVTRRRAYGMQPGGPGFFSDKQRRFVMASLRAGRNLRTGAPMEPGYPHRTGAVQRAWKIEGNDPRLTTIRNTSQAAGFLFSDTRQARQAGLVGWQKLGELVEDNIKGAVEAAADAAKEAVLKSIK